MIYGGLRHTLEAPTTAPRPAAHAAALTSSSLVRLPWVLAPDMLGIVMNIADRSIGGFFSCAREVH